MPDVFSISKRSEVMSRIRSSGNKGTELALIRLFRQEGITGWRRRWPLAGKPDFTFPKLRLTIFVDGCFWHGCMKHSRPPKSNQAYWDAKIVRNKARDLSVSQELRKRGWRVMRIWEHELTHRNEGRLLRRIRRALETPPPS